MQVTPHTKYSKIDGLKEIQFPSRATYFPYSTLILLDRGDHCVGDWKIHHGCQWLNTIAKWVVFLHLSM